MAWLAKLDARAEHWRAPARWLYTGLKWYLVAVGVFIVIVYYLQKLGLWRY